MSRSRSTGEDRDLTAANDLAAWYRQVFGEPFPLSLTGTGSPDVPDFFRSDGNPILSPASLVIPYFAEGIAAYHAMGLCAFGPQTTYFVLTRVDAVRRHYFRLGFESAYARSFDAKTAIVDFVRAYAVWDARFAQVLDASEITYSTGLVEVALRTRGSDALLTLNAIPQAVDGPTPPPSELWSHLTRMLLTAG